MRRPRLVLAPRKTPLQARSVHTVEAICQACIQVLVKDGLDRLTTVRVAARAGVSIGSLYQYFPNKQALLAAVLERHLTTVVAAVDAACKRSQGQRLDAMAGAVVEAFVAAKLADPAAARVLYAAAAEVGGAALVRRLSQRAQRALAEMLGTAPGARFANLNLAAFMVATAMVGPVQALLEPRVTPAQRDAIAVELRQMLAGYLAAAGRPPRDAAARVGQSLHAR